MLTPLRRIWSPAVASAPPRGSSTPIPPTVQRKLEVLLLGSLRSELPFLPTAIAQESSVDIPQHTILKECLGDSCFQYTLTGMTAGQRGRAATVIQTALDRDKLPLSATIGGEMVLINPKGVDKGTALEHFAQEIGVAPSEVLKFGDKPGPQGNDKSFMRDANSFNVGDEKAHHPACQDVGILGPDGVLAVLDRLERSGKTIRAIASDFDGTLNPGGIGHTSQIDPRLAKRFVEYARKGVKVAIITGRGESLFPNYLPQLRRAGLDPAASRNLQIYLFNGARQVQPGEWIGGWGNRSEGQITGTA